MTEPRIAARQQVVAELVRQGLSTRDIATYLSITRRTVCRDRVALGLPDGNEMAREAQRQRREATRELTHGGMGTGDIAKKLDIDIATVRRDRRALGLPNGHVLLAESRDERRAVVAELCREGWTAGDIAAHLGTTARTVERDKGDLGLSTRHRNAIITADEHRQIRSMLATGHSLAEVARTLGRNPSHIGKIYRGQGWTPSQTGEFNRLRSLRERLELIDGGR